MFSLNLTCNLCDFSVIFAAMSCESASSRLSLNGELMFIVLYRSFAINSNLFLFSLKSKGSNWSAEAIAALFRKAIALKKKIRGTGISDTDKAAAWAEISGKSEF